MTIPEGVMKDIAILRRDEKIKELQQQLEAQSRELERLKQVVAACNKEKAFLATPAAMALMEHHQACSVSGYTDSDGCPNPPACHPDCQVAAMAVQQAKEEM